MAIETPLLSPKEINLQNSVKIHDFLQSLRADDLVSGREWNEKDKIVAQKLTSYVAEALPPSIRSITYPNGAKAILGKEDDKVRVVNWDLIDIKKYAERLAKNSKF